jgi:hypothetical protein
VERLPYREDTSFLVGSNPSVAQVAKQEVSKAILDVGEVLEVLTSSSASDAKNCPLAASGTRHMANP